MEIQVRCDCGTRFQVEHEYVGNRAVCPVCGRFVDIAGQVSAAAPQAAAQIQQPPPPLPQTTAQAPLNPYTSTAVADRSDAVKNIVSDWASRINDKYIYFAPNLPTRKLTNALKAYANVAADEEILVLIDNTVFGSAKDGALLTTRKIYAHDIGESSHDMDISRMQTLLFVEGLTSKLYINDIKFLEINMPEKRQIHLFTDMLKEIAALFHSQPAGKSSVDALKELKELYDAGIITEEEFAAKKKQFLAAM